MAKAVKNNKPTKLTKLSFEGHFKKWEERKSRKKSYILNELDMRKGNMKLLLNYNAKYQYNNKTQDLNILYDNLCDTLNIFIKRFNEEIVGDLINFLLTDNRFYLKPYQIANCLRNFNKIYNECCELWDNFVLDNLPYAYKTLLTIRYEVKSFLKYFAFEVVAQKCISKNSSFLYLKIINSFLEKLQIPISVYVDSYFLRKILLIISQKSVPAFSIKCTHPLLMQINHIFLNYYALIKKNWQRIVTQETEYKLSLISESDMSIIFQAFLTEHFQTMVRWKNKDYTDQMNAKVKLYIVNILNYNLPNALIHEAILAGFHGIISVDISSNYVDYLFKIILSYLNDFLKIAVKWNRLIGLRDAKVYGNGEYVVDILISLFNLFVKSNDFNESMLMVEIIANQLNKHVLIKNDVDLLLIYLANYSWDTNKSISDQVFGWFKKNKECLQSIVDRLNEARIG